MKQYYQNNYTDLSFNLLSQLNREINLILIGGWAVWLYTKSLKSKDVDFIIDYEDLSKLQSKYEVVNNHRLKKYEITRNDIHADIYLPYYSFLGIPVEEVMKYQTKIEGFTLAQKEMLLIMKQTAYLDRVASVKGQKDKIDILAIIFLPDFDFDEYDRLLKKYHFTDYEDNLQKILKETREVPELGLNRHAYAKEKRRITKEFRITKKRLSSKIIS